MLFSSATVVPLAITLALALALAGIAWRRPRAGRVLLAVTFGLAAAFNVEVALASPADYQGFAPLAVLDGYRDFIAGAFARHTPAFVLAIAAGQAMIAAGLIVGGRLARVALAGAIGFLVAITPLGAGSAFPAPLVLAAAAAEVLARPAATAESMPAWIRAWARRRLAHR